MKPTAFTFTPPPVESLADYTAMCVREGKTITLDQLQDAPNQVLHNGPVRISHFPDPRFLAGAPFNNDPGPVCPPAALPTIVGVYAPSRQMGKSTFCKAVKSELERYGRKVVVVSFADALRELSKRLLLTVGYTPVVAETMLRAGKDYPVPFKNPHWSGNDTTFTGRDVLVTMGEGVRDIVSEDAWVDAFERAVRRLNLPKNAFVLCDDMRRPNEKELIETLGGLTVYLQRGEVPLTAKEVEGQLQDEPFDFEFEFPQDDLVLLHKEAKTFAKVLMRD